jgi:hypothetical protein
MMLQAGNLKDTSLKPSSQSTSVIDISQPDATKKPNAQKPAGKGQTNAPNATKGIDNQMRPANQFGKRTSPNIKRMDNQFLSTIESLLDEEYNTIQDDVGLISDIEDLSNVKTGTK